MNDKLIETFLAEANDLIVELEKALLLLETDLHNKEGIAAIFRSMHTLKGAAGMFGFQAVNTITHHLESIYQDIRDGKRMMDEQILRTTFRTMDQLRVLFEQEFDNNETNAEYEELLQTIKNLEKEKGKGNIDSVSDQTNTTGSSALEATYYIYLMPKPDVMRNGTNPLYLVDDLLIMGTGLALPFFKDLPEFSEIEPDKSYLGFEVLLSTDKGEEEIKSVFLFAEDACDLSIQKVADGNWLKDVNLEEKPWFGRDFNSPLSFEVIFAELYKELKKDESQLKDQGRKISLPKNSNIRVSAERLDDLMNLVSELVTTQASLALFANSDHSQDLTRISENIEKITRRLRDNAFTMSLIPLDTIVVRFQRLVSDLSKELNKEIEFKAEGMETKIDKSIIEKLTDPLLHIIRNSIDHGIEKPEARTQKGKSAKGTVKIKSYYSGASVIIEISDDGAGLNLERIKSKAIENGIIEAHAELSEQEVINLIFMPGFSTATEVTGVSGRGVGMDVVKRNITDIRGEVEVSTALGKGTTFSIRLPLTLSIMDGLLVQIGETDFLIPLSSVAKCYEAETHLIESTYNNWITLEGIRTPYVYLREAFGIETHKPELSQIINIPYQEGNVGLVVDKIIGEYQAVLKPLGHYYLSQDEFSGATILGNGLVALVLDPIKIIKKLATINS